MTTPNITHITPRVSIEDGRVLFKGQPVETALAHQILERHIDGRSLEGRARLLEIQQTMIPGTTEPVEIYPDLFIKDGLLMYKGRLFTDNVAVDLLEKHANNAADVLIYTEFMGHTLDLIPAIRMNECTVPWGSTPKPEYSTNVSLTSNVSVTNGVLLFKGIEQKSAVSDYILSQHALGEDTTQVAALLEHLLTTVPEKSYVSTDYSLR